MLSLLYFVLFSVLASVITIGVVVLCGFVITRRSKLRSIDDKSQGSRGLFWYSDGRKIRSIDPIAAILSLEGHPEFRFDLHVVGAQEGDKESIRIVSDAVRKTFAVDHYTDPSRPGLTINEQISLLGYFLNFVDAQKKNGKASPIYAASTESMSSGSNDATTNDMSVSGSTDIEASPNKA